jgi:hypothetical protein
MFIDTRNRVYEFSSVRSEIRSLGHGEHNMTFLRSFI